MAKLLDVSIARVPSDRARALVRYEVTVTPRPDAGGTLADTRAAGDADEVIVVARELVEQRWREGMWILVGDSQVDTIAAALEALVAQQLRWE